MTIKEIDYKLLHKVELDLNTIQFNGLDVGNLLSYYFDRLYHNEYNDTLFRKLALLIYYFVKPWKNKQILKNFNKELIYFRTGAHRHHLNMESALSESVEIDNNTLYISPRNNEGVNRTVFLMSSIFNFFEIHYFLLRNFLDINKFINPLALPIILKIKLILDLQLQLLKANSLKKYIQLQKSTKLIGADYDRGLESSLFFAVAKALQIKSFTFQHGVLNPPVGYSPINADEIWVWGMMAQKQLIELGVTTNKIRITGTPIVQDIEISEKIRQSLVQKYQLKSGRTFVLALSYPNKLNDAKLVDFFSKVKKNYSMLEDNFFVKIHPARNYNEYKWIKECYNIDLLPPDVPYQDLMNMLDILVAHTSGIASEVLYYNKMVAILDILELSLGNGLELNKYFGVPILKLPTDFINIKQVNFSPDKKDILFYKIGFDAKLTIQKTITSYLNTSN